MLAALMARRPVSKELWRQLQPLIPTFVPSAKGGARKLAGAMKLPSTASCSGCKQAFRGKTFPNPVDTAAA
jgi:hypothetical protein